MSHIDELQSYTEFSAEDITTIKDWLNGSVHPSNISHFLDNKAKHLDIHFKPNIEKHIKFLWTSEIKKI